MPPGASPMETPAIPLEIGNSSTVASLAVFLPVTRPLDFSRENLKFGSSLPENRGSGTLFMKLGSPAWARPVAARAAVTPAANAAVPFRKSRRWISDIGSPYQNDSGDGSTRRLRTARPERAASQLPQERHQVLLLLLRQLQLQHQVEELDGVLQRQAAAVVEVRRAILDATEREALDRPISRLAVQGALQVQVVHLLDKVERRGVAHGAPGLAEEQLLAA